MAGPSAIPEDCPCTQTLVFVTLLRLRDRITVMNVNVAEQTKVLLERAAKGRSGVLVVHGVTGAGQADVVSNVRNAVSEVPGGLVLEGRCTGMSSIPFEPMHSIVAALQVSGPEVCDPALLASVASRLSHVNQEVTEPQNVRAVLDQIGGLRDRRLNHFEDLRRLLCDVAGRTTTLLMIHDVHLADEDTLGLINFLVRDADGGVPVIGAATHRAHRPAFVLTLCDDHPCGRSLLRQFEAIRVVESTSVAPLDAHDLSQLMAEPVLSSKLLRITEGLPTRVRALISVLPDELDELVRYRISTLQPDALHTLHMAQANGGPVVPGVLASVADVGWNVVNALQADEFLVEEVVGGQSHVRLNDAYQDHPTLCVEDESQRSIIHGAWADHWTTQHQLTNDESLLGCICDHLLQAGRAEEASTAAIRASHWLAQRGGTQRSVALLDRVLAAGVSDPTPILVATIDAQVALGDFDAALARCGDLVDRADSYVDLRRAQIHGLSGDLDAASKALRTLFESKGVPTSLRSVVLREWADVLVRQGELEEAERLCTEALNASEPLDEMTSLSLHHTQGKIAFWRASYEEARTIYQKVLDDSQRATDTGFRATALHNVGLVDMRTGHYVQSARRIQEALGLFEGCGRYFEAAVCRHNLGIAYEYNQRTALAVAMFEQTIDVFERLGKRANLAGAINSLGDVYLSIGEAWKARRLFQHSLTIAEENGLNYLVAFNALRLGQVDLLDGQSEKAQAHLMRAVAALENQGHHHELAEAHLALAQCALAADDQATTIEHLELLEACGHREATARGWILRARLQADKNPGNAEELLQRAALALEELGQASGVLEASLELVLIERQVGGPATQRLSEVSDLLEQWRKSIPTEHLEAFDELPLVRRVQEVLSPSEEMPSAPQTITSERVSQPVATEPSCYHGMVGRSPKMRALYKVIDRIASADATILLAGESGTGKELVANAIYNASHRANKAFVRVNSAAFVDSLLESELFGHEKGSFTGAVNRKMGAFEQADGGTLFLDEIGDISPKMQVSLLRALQEGEIRRVGGRKPMMVDVRVICATNRDLDAMVEAGTFRQDLYFRIKGLPIALPALRERGDDIVLLAEHILADLEEKHGRAFVLATDAIDLLRVYPWPGNVRELENVLRSVIFFAEGDAITAHDLLHYTSLKEMCEDGESAQGPEPSGPVEDEVIGGGFDLAEAKREMELRYIKRALEQTDGNITKAAELLNMKRPRLSQKIKEYRQKGWL